MASMETAVFISVFIALVVLFIDFFVTPTILVGVLAIIVITGFIASAMAGSEKNSYRVGGIAGGVLAVLFFLVNFFTAPQLSFNLYSLNFDPGLIFQGMIYLILGFVLSLAIFMLLGAFGGLIAEELFGPKDSKPRRKPGNTKTV